jgi:hypothetical protein
LGQLPADGTHFLRPTRVWGQPRERRGYPRHGFGGNLPPTVPPNHGVSTVDGCRRHFGRELHVTGSACISTVVCTTSSTHTHAHAHAPAQNVPGVMRLVSPRTHTERHSSQLPPLVGQPGLRQPVIWITHTRTCAHAHTHAPTQNVPGVMRLVSACEDADHYYTIVSGSKVRTNRPRKASVSTCMHVNGLGLNHSHPLGASLAHSLAHSLARSLTHSHSFLTPFSPPTTLFCHTGRDPHRTDGQHGVPATGEHRRGAH